MAKARTKKATKKKTTKKKATNARKKAASKKASSKKAKPVAKKTTRQASRATGKATARPNRKSVDTETILDVLAGIETKQDRILEILLGPSDQSLIENAQESTDPFGLNAPASKATKDDVVNALQELVALQGQPTAMQLLNDFKAEKISDLDESDYESFIDSCIDLSKTNEEATSTQNVDPFA